ncbi:hypothetical protein ACE1N8_25840 [Streptomyces sp. DSM 116494]|uniref:hypothetical protein n=1 Tax=Streptomyces okerensis TaxID=3344655 RepID=UPI003890DCC7
MNVEGITALVAAGAAVVGVSATAIVGRWQLRGALRAADATARAGIAQAEAASRAGIAQAEAAYRAALDAVRATGTEAHAQWLRTVRRETYTLFLRACHDVVDAAESLARDAAAGTIPRDQRQTRKTQLETALGYLKHCATTLQVEGPDMLWTPAQHILVLSNLSALAGLRRFELHMAWQDVKALTEERRPDQRIVAFYQAGRDYLDLLTYGPPSQQSDEELTRARFETACDSLPYWRHACLEQATLYARGEAERAQDDQRRSVAAFQRDLPNFISSIRTVLETT